jgi:hypothetical protein
MFARLFEPRLLLLYQMRPLGKSLKARSRLAYYALKYVLIDGLFYSIFLA